MQSSLRKERIKSLSNAIKSGDETIALLQNQKQKYSSVEKYLEPAEINRSIFEIMEQKQLKVKESEKFNKAETRSKKTKKKKVGKETSSNLPSPIKGWLTKESSSNSGDETEIVDETNDAVHILSQAGKKKQEKKGSTVTVQGPVVRKAFNLNGV